MARKKLISREDIIATAYRSWISLGYHATGLRELSSEIGFSIASLLHRFQSKEAMMCEVLDHCRQCWNTSLARLSSREIPWQARWDALHQQLLSQGTESALLLAVVAIECPSLPPRLQGLAKEAQGTLEGWLVRLLMEGKRRGDWQGEEPTAFARETLQNILGQHLLARLR